MKKDILKEADYRYDFDRDMYFNREAKKAFSLEFVADTPEQELAKHIEETLNPIGWTFYFNSPPSESVQRELERLLDK
uniref:Uncharacterized protein n=1 Tax=mine drainage metagenome TaxID=410659 RepID=E6QKF0_9ZZZZ